MKWLLALLLIPTAALGQTCSSNAPCAGVNVTTTVPSNVGNSTSTLFACMGAASGSQFACNATTLAAYLADPTQPTAWKTLGTFPQKALTVQYNDQEAPGALMNYAALNTPSGGAAGPVSAIWVFQFPQAQTAPTLGGKLVTTGSTGPQ